MPFGRLLEATRGQLRGKGVRGAGTDHRTLDRALALFPHPERLRPLMGLLRAYQRSGLQRLCAASVCSTAPGRSGRWRPCFPPCRPHLRRHCPRAFPPRGRARGRAGLLIGCVQRFFFPEVNAQTARLLAAAGYEVVIPPGQGCCGALHLHAGRVDEFRAMARALVAAFGDAVDVIVTNAAGCGSALREYGHWLEGEGGRRFAARVRDVSEVLVEADLPLGEIRGTVTYHDACHLAHGQQVRHAPRALLRRIPGLRLIELRDSDLCCGSAGVYNLIEPEMAGELARRKVERIRETGARVVASGNPGCLMQIAREARAQGLDLDVLHPVELLGRALAATEGRENREPVRRSPEPSTGAS